MNTPKAHLWIANAKRYGITAATIAALALTGSAPPIAWADTLADNGASLQHDTAAATYDSSEDVARGITAGEIAVLYGKDYVDNISLKGKVWVSGTWNTTVHYDSTLVDAASANGIPASVQPGTPTTGSTEGGVDDDFGKEGYQTFDSETGEWTAARQNGRDNDGKIDLLYSTEGGPWVPASTLDGDQEADGDDTHVHTNGTYLLTVPTAITYTGMKVGSVNTSDDYLINVAGVVPAGKVIKVWAESGKTLDGPSEANSHIVETTSMVTPNLSGETGEYSDADNKVVTYSNGDTFRIVTPAEAANPIAADEQAGAALTYLTEGQ